MSRQPYPEEFKIEAVKQGTEKSKPVADVAQRLGMSVHSLYAWIKVCSKPQEQRQQDDDRQAELRKLRAELKRVPTCPRRHTQDRNRRQAVLLQKLRYCAMTVALVLCYVFGRSRRRSRIAAWFGLLILPGGRGRSPGWRSTLSAIWREAAADLANTIS